jgi:hypothetical protein
MDGYHRLFAVYIVDEDATISDLRLIGNIEEN